MSRPLHGQVALVAGAGSGIGAEVAGRLAQQGAAVGVNGRSEQEGRATARPGRREQEAGIPAGRLGLPSEVAALIAYLASPAAAYISGTSVVLDGALMTQVSMS